MAWRVVQISRPCLLKIKNRQLVYVPQDKGEEITLPLEDIAVLILEHRQINFSHVLLAELAEYGICLFSCDAKHIPNGAFMPFHTHSRYAAVAAVQLQTAVPLRKRLWQEVVRAKIENQALCLQALGIGNAQKLFALVKNVQSGDAANCEAGAARLYFADLFEHFTRQQEDDFRNEYLNYAYALLRGCVARALVGAGLLPFLGIHHANKLNAYNLADDMIEPFRPFADYLVKRLEEKSTSLTPKIKQELLAVFTLQCEIKEEVRGILAAADTMASSLVQAMEQRNPKLLMLPRFIQP